MPLKAHKNADADSVVTPFEVDRGLDVYCTECGGLMNVVRSYTREDGVVVIRHFRHKSENGNRSGGDCGGGGGGEGDRHLRAKNIVVKTLDQFYPDGEAVSEREFDLPDSFSKETRTADAVVGFDRPHPRFGDGIVVEVQDKHKEKDVLETTRAYLTNGYSVCWLSVDDFGKYSLKYSQAEFEKLVRNEFPDADSVFEAELNPDGTVPRNEMYPLVAAACPHSIAVKRDDSRGYGMYEEWFTGMIRHPDFRRRFLQGAEGIEFSSHRNYTITLPREWYEERARQYFRETPWQDFFESYTWDTDEVQEEWGELAAIDEMEVKIPLSKWLADDGKVLVVGEETNHPRYNHQTRGDFIPDTSELVGWEGLPDDKLAAFIPDSDLQNAETESDSAMVLRDGRDYERVNNLEFYVPARTLWNVTPWESRFSDGLELPIAPDVDGEETTPTAQIPFGYWITSGDVPDTIKNELMRAHHRGRRNMPKSEKDKAEAKERVPRIIRHNTGDPQPDTIAKHHVLTITSHANISPDAVRWALPRLVQSGEIEEPEPERYRLPAE